VDEGEMERSMDADHIKKMDFKKPYETFQVTRTTLFRLHGKNVETKKAVKTDLEVQQIAYFLLMASQGILQS
jgi:hypothetical protein